MQLQNNASIASMWRNEWYFEAVHELHSLLMNNDLVGIVNVWTGMESG